MDHINPMLGDNVGQLTGVPPGEEFVSPQHGTSKDSIFLSQGFQPAPRQPDAHNSVTSFLKFNAASVEVKLKSAKGGGYTQFQDVHESIDIFLVPELYSHLPFIR